MDLEPVTLNQLISLLTELASESGNGDKTVVSIGACSGTFDGLRCPFSINLKNKKGQTDMYLIPSLLPLEPNPKSF